jgi:ferredoxin
MTRPPYQAYPQAATTRPATTGQSPRQVRPAGPARAAGPRLHIDWTACDGRGACTELLPELLGRDEWGYPVPRDGSRDPVVPDGLAKHAQRAVDACPVLALRLLPRR